MRLTTSPSRASASRKGAPTPPTDGSPDQGRERHGGDRARRERRGPGRRKGAGKARHADEQQMIAAVAGELVLGATAPWSVKHRFRLEADEHGAVTVSRLIRAGDIDCKEVVFTVEKLAKGPRIDATSRPSAELEPHGAGRRRRPPHVGGARCSEGAAPRARGDGSVVVGCSSIGAISGGGASCSRFLRQRLSRGHLPVSSTTMATVLPRDSGSQPAAIADAIARATNSAGI